MIETATTVWMLFKDCSCRHVVGKMGETVKVDEARHIILIFSCCQGRVSLYYCFLTPKAPQIYLYMHTYLINKVFKKRELGVVNTFLTLFEVFDLKVSIGTYIYQHLQFFLVVLNS